MRWTLELLQVFEVGVVAGLGHGCVESFPGHDIVFVAVVFVSNLAKYLCVLSQLGNILIYGVALTQQFLSAQRQVQQARLFEDF